MDISKDDSLLPNPLSDKSTITGLYKKLGVLTGGLSLALQIKKLIFLLILFPVLVSVFKFLIPTALAFIGTQLVASLISIYLTYAQTRAIANIISGSETERMKYLAVQGTYYELLSILAHAIFGVVWLYLFLHFFQSDTQVSLGMLRSALSGFNVFIVAFVAFMLFDFFIQLVEFNLLKKFDTAYNIAEFTQRLQILSQKIDLFRSGVLSVSLLFCFYVIRVPFLFIMIGGSVMTLFFLLSWITLRRVARVNLAVRTPTEPIFISIVPGEKIIDAVFGILNQKSWGYSFLGSGKFSKPENALLITDHRMLFVQVPMPGGDKMVSGTVNMEDNFFWNR
ncbi:MAG: hypothetical protein V4465_00985 [Patescibacteria group bacterium]